MIYLREYSEFISIYGESPDKIQTLRYNFRKFVYGETPNKNNKNSNYQNIQCILKRYEVYFGQLSIPLNFLLIITYQFIKRVEV